MFLIYRILEYLYLLKDRINVKVQVINIYIIYYIQKNILKNKVKLLQTSDENDFGKEFSNHLTEPVKSKKSSKKVFQKLDDSKNPFDLALHFKSNSVRAELRSILRRAIYPN